MRPHCQSPGVHLGYRCILSAFGFRYAIAAKTASQFSWRAPFMMRLDEAAKGEGRRRPDVRGALGSLFPESPESAPPVPVRRLLSAVLHLVAIALGAVLLLERIPGIPSWDTIYNEDYWQFLRQALQQPWHVFIPYGGYYQLLPRVIAQFAQYLPLAQASRLFAVCGALIASGCGLFIFYA